jgi:hypothetical protein
MRATSRFFVVVTLAATFASLTVSTAGATGAGRSRRIPHPTSADVVVFHTESSRNGWGGEYPHATEVTVFGDGRVVYGDGSELRVTERGLQRLLRDARAAGLLDDTDFGQAGVTDQGTTTVEINAGGGAHTVAVYALELPEGDTGLPKAQRTARRELRRFLHALGKESYWNGAVFIR